LKVLPKILILFLYCNHFLVWAQSNQETQKSPNATSIDSLGVTPLNSYHGSDTSMMFQVNKILILGNKKTKSKIILRELTFKEGDNITKYELEKKLNTNRKNIINTRLFVTVEVEFLDLGNQRVDILIQVSERWYSYPIPIFKLADRNFSEWWTNQNRSLDRINYGIRLIHKNFRGRNEQVKITAQFGFTRKLELIYRIPYINRAQTNGLSFNFSYRENKQAAYRTFDHKQQFINSKEATDGLKDKVIRERFRGSISFTRRKDIHVFHSFTTGYANTWVDDTVASSNPDYFLGGANTQEYFRLRYSFRRDFRDIRVYPLSGYFFDFNAEKIGLGIFDDVNQFEINSSFARYYELNKGYFFSWRAGGKFSVPIRQPYTLFRAMGFGRDLIRGYELNVIEGQHMVIAQTTFKKLLFKTQQKLDKYVPIQQFQTFPLAVYIKTFFDSGYVGVDNSYPNNDRLSNEYIYGTGVGLDFVTFYDFVMRTEFSVNSEGETHFFFNVKAEF